MDHKNINQQSDKERKVYLRRPLAELNVIDNFLFTTLLTRDDTKERAALLILNSILDQEIRHVKVTAQKEYPGMDTGLHGIRLDVSITDEDDATVYDLEPDKRSSEAASLPKRNRFYSAIIDSRNLQSGMSYDKVPKLVIIMILSYDPFGAGDMYYEAGTSLKTHVDLDYDDGIRRIYLYADGNNNLSGSAGEKVQAMVKYIRHSDKDHVVNEATAEMDGIVQRVKENKEVSMVYLRALEREQELLQEGNQKGHQEADEYYQPIIEQKDQELATEKANHQKDIDARDRAIAEAEGLRARLAKYEPNLALPTSEAAEGIGDFAD